MSNFFLEVGPIMGDTRNGTAMD